MNDRRISVFIVEDEALTRAGARRYLEDEYDIVGEADNVTDAIGLIQERQPDVVLLDVRIREGNGAAVVAAIKRSHPEIRFLALTVSTARSDVLRLMRAGVDGYLTKQLIGTDLSDAVAQVVRGERPFSRQVAAYLLDIDEGAASVDGLERLTVRERQVVVLVARGYTYREVAKELAISIKTLETHMNHIFRKVGVASRHELSTLAFETGFVAPAPHHQEWP